MAFIHPVCTILILLPLMPYVVAQTNPNINVGDTLIAGNDTAQGIWLSASGDFAFGFHQLENDLFLLAIWYNKIPEKTIIWYANGDNPAPRGSILQLNDTQGLVLSSPQGTQLWRSNFSSATASYSLLNDTGNLAVLDQSSKVLWNSFSHPTDTLVPSQVVEINGFLFSRQTETNFSRGSFEFRMQPDGNFVQSLINVPTNHSYVPYASTRTADSQNVTNVGVRVVFDESGFLYVLKKSGEMLYITQPTNSASIQFNYIKATINFDGVFTVSYRSKDSTTNQNWTVLTTMPDNICTEFTGSMGKGVCGFNSICILNNDQRPLCKCPEGYSLVDPENGYGGCIPNFELRCQQQGSQEEEDLYIMRDLSKTDWPQSDYELYSPYNLEDCKNSCLQDCLCMVSYFAAGSCWKKKLPLSYGREDRTVTGTAFMKLMRNDSGITLPNPSSKKKDRDSLIIVISVLLGGSVLIIFLLLGVICFRLFGCNYKMLEMASTSKDVSDRNIRIFTFKELAQATNSFKDELGKGSCGIVYKGQIEMTTIAVKKLDKVLQDSDKEFKTEVSVIGQTYHKNLVRLLGYCDEGQHRILVYEFMSNGSLASFLFGQLKPNWKQRIHFVLGIARGLFYLHEECFTQIIHCDIKPQNILLDDNYNARISDFGLSKLLLVDQSGTETAIRGTKGYVAPDWFKIGPINAKVDVYSFGVLLLEIICCRKNVEKDIENEENAILTDWAYDCYRARKLEILVENDDEAMSDMMRLERFVRIAIWCLQEDPSIRPTMKEVLLMLEGIVPVKIPPNPCSCSFAC